MEERALRVDAGNNGFDRDFFPAGEHDTIDSSLFDVNVLDFRIRSNLSASLLRGFSERACEGAEASTWESRGANGMGVRSSPKKEHSG